MIRSYNDLVDEILGLPGAVRLVSVDGPGGAGKSTFAGHLSRARPDAITVVHTDDFASPDNPTDWWPHLLEQVIIPLARGGEGVFQRYDWERRELAEWITVPRSPIVVIEGVSAGRREWEDHLSFRIWVETPAALRLKRGLERDGDELADQWREWMDAEDHHFARDPSQDRADLTVVGDSTEPYDPTREFAVRDDGQ